MPACTRRAVSMGTDFLTSDDIEATARRTGFVQRASKMTGTLFRALVTCGTWSEANTTLAPGAAKITPLGHQVNVSPAALHQRMHTKAMAFLQAMLRQALAKVQALEHVCDEGLCTALTPGYLADSTGVGLPEALHNTFPGSGGRAANAGANIHAVWDDQNSLVGHVALTPWNIPDQRSLDTVVEGAHAGMRCIVALGYVTRTAFARLATAGAYFFSRLKHHTTRLTTAAGRWHPVDLAPWRTTVEGQLLERSIVLGEQARVASRLMASRVPEAIGNERRRNARTKAQKKGYTPAKAHLTLLAWTLCMTNVPPRRWTTDTVGKVSPVRWHIARMCKSWKSSLHGATLTTKKEDPTLWYLYGRMLLMLLTYALCPQRRAPLWMKKKRELRLLKRMRHLQAFAASWMQAIFQSKFVVHRVLVRVCATAERLVGKASRKRRTTAQILQERLCQQHESVACAEAVNA